MPLAAARRDYFAGSNSGVDAAGIQDVRDVGDVVKKFTLPRGVGSRGNLPQRSVIVGVGPPSRDCVRNQSR